MKLKNIIIYLTLFSCPTIVNAEKECSKNIPNPPLSGQIKIAEIFPESTGDDNGWVGLKNVSDICIDLAGWVLYDGNLEHELFVTPENSEGFNDGLLLASGSEAKVYQKGDRDFTLDSKGGRAELYSGPAEMLGEMQDSISYPEIDSGGTYRVITVSEDKQHNYKIPEDANREVGSREQEAGSKKNAKTTNKDNQKTQKEAPGSTWVEGSNNETRLRQGYDGQAIQQLNNELPSFVASTGDQRSPWRWFYFLWGNWFVRRIILPFIGVWLTLYVIACLLRGKLTKESE